MAVARSSSGGVVIRYLVPLLRMTSYLLISQGCSTSPPSWSSAHAALGLLPGVKLWGIPSDLRSSTSYLRSSTSNDRSCTWQSRSSTFAGQNSSIKQYLNSTKAKQSHLNARKPLSAVGKPTFALGPSGSSFGPSGRAPTGIHHLLLSNLTTACC